MNTLFRKVYFLAGVVMAANMFVVNEVRASDMMDTYDLEKKLKEIPTEEQNNSDSPGKNTSLLKNVLNFVLTYENYINFIGGLVSSGFINNYFKWWDYNPGGYLNPRIGCLGLRSKRFLYDVVQFEFNFNLGRGALWTILLLLNTSSMLNTVKGKNKATITEAKMPSLATPQEQNFHRFRIVDRFRIVARSIEGFISIPLAIHIQGFDISIALDSILFGLVVNIWLFPRLSSPFVYKNYIVSGNHDETNDVFPRPSFSGDYNEIKDIKEKPVKIYNN